MMSLVEFEASSYLFFEAIVGLKLKMFGKSNKISGMDFNMNEVFLLLNPNVYAKLQKNISLAIDKLI